MEKARAGIETRAQARSATELAEPEKKRAARLARQQTVEPVFGLIKSAMGFRPFQLRGAGKASTGWTLVCLASNLRRRHTLGAGTKLAAAR